MLNSWKRVIVHLPVTYPANVLAYSDIINYLNNQQQAPAGSVKGFTYTNPLPSPLSGYWWDDQAECWIYDEIALIYIDLDIKNMQQLDKEL
ncbi:hypothetical protein L0222_05195 [bacterium]|nr:hypothetical protein [bacterium]